MFLLEFQVQRGPHVGDAHVLPGRGGAPFVVVPEGLGQRVLARLLRKMTRWRHPVPVWRLVLVEQQEGLRVVAVVEIVQRELGDQIRHVAFALHLLAVVDEHRVVVVPLVDEDLPLVEARRRGLQMPLADDGRLVAGRLQQLRQRHLAAVEGVAVVAQPVQVTVLAGQQNGAARRADRVRDEAVREAHAFTGDAIDVRRLDQVAAVGADRALGMIVRHDEQDVRRPIRLVGKSHPRKEYEKKC